MFGALRSHSGFGLCGESHTEAHVLSISCVHSTLWVPLCIVSPGVAHPSLTQGGASRPLYGAWQVENA